MFEAALPGPNRGREQAMVWVGGVSVMVTQLVSVPAKFQDQLRGTWCEWNLLIGLSILLLVFCLVRQMSQVPGESEQA